MKDVFRSEFRDIAGGHHPYLEFCLESTKEVTSSPMDRPPDAIIRVKGTTKEFRISLNGMTVIKEYSRSGDYVLDVIDTLDAEYGDMKQLILEWKQTNGFSDEELSYSI